MTAETTQARVHPGDPLPGEVHGRRVPVDRVEVGPAGLVARPGVRRLRRGRQARQRQALPAVPPDGPGLRPRRRPKRGEDTVVTLPGRVGGRCRAAGFGRDRCRPTSASRSPCDAETDVMHQDAAQLSIVGSATLVALGRHEGDGRPLDPRHLRANVVVADRAAVCRGGLGRTGRHHRRGAAAGQRADRAVPDGRGRAGRAAAPPGHAARRSATTTTSTPASTRPSCEAGSDRRRRPGDGGRTALSGIRVAD